LVRLLENMVLRFQICSDGMAYGGPQFELAKS